MITKTPITVAYGDGIGPEIMQATLRILEAAGAQLAIEPIEIGEKVYQSGISSGIMPETWDSLRRTKVLLKAPITTPQGGGYKSPTVTIRKTLGLYANVRPCLAYAPFVKTQHPLMDIVIIRENEEDLYAGVEHRQTQDVFQSLKLVTIPGCERIIRYAFEYAKHYQRKKVTCFTADNLLKLTDGLFHKVFDRIALDYPEIATEHWIVDTGATKLAAAPEQFDVIVLPNLYGDILSDVAAEIAGSVGLAGSANIGEHCAMFEAFHGSALRIAGQNKANPSGLLLAAIKMLVHIGQPEVAQRVHNAWIKTIEEGIHTYDVYQHDKSHCEVGTQEFAQAVIERLGQMPTQLPAISYPLIATPIQIQMSKPVQTERELIGVDVFVHFSPQRPLDELVQALQQAAGDEFKLCLITNRGIKVWPERLPETFCVDHWRCRFKLVESSINNMAIAKLLQRMAEVHIDFIKTEHLYQFDGEPGYSLAQGE